MTSERSRQVTGLPTREGPPSGPEGPAFLPGTVLAGRYRIVSPLGRGGMGEVYRADDLKLGQSVALKFLPARLRHDPNRRQRLRDEVKLARLVAHPNVCRVWDVVESDGHEFLAMEYVDGEDLASLLRRIGRLPQERAVRMARELCAGLGAIHDQGLLHRDLKPANVMVDGRGRVRVADFGLAAVAERVAGADIQAGTPAYMSPEQREGREVTVRSDIYALGLILYEVFTGQPGDPSSTPSNDVKDLDPAIDRAIERCLEADAALRPPSASALAAALPGGDPLAAALAAGETPSPELVAAAGGKGGLRAPVAYACLAAIVAGIVLVAWLADRVSPFYLDLDKPLEVLAYEARQLVSDLGPVPPPVDSARGFLHEGATRPRRLVFWYRQSPSVLSETRRLLELTSFENPPPSVPGMSGVRLDAHGTLLEYVRAPAADDAPAAGAPDWPALLHRARLETARAVPPEAIPPVFGDERFAWDAELHGVRVRAEASAFRGRPVWFRVAPSGPGPGGASSSLLLLFYLAILVMAAVLARHQLHVGRADREGARRIAGFVAVLCGLAGVLRGPEGIQDGVLLVLIVCFSAVASWVFYIALEPIVRRSWPDTLVSWTRLLRGHPLDPLVGRHVLLGVLGGVAVALLGQGARAARGPAASRWPTWPVPLNGNWLALGDLCANVVGALVEGLFVLLLFAMVRRVLRWSWVAVAVVLLVVIVPQHVHSPPDLLSQLAIRGALWGLIIRPGLLTGVVAMVVRTALGLGLMTTHLDAWYADSAVCGIFATLVLAGWGFYASLGGRLVSAHSSGAA
jgi:serine/threonine-protein kinase